MARFLAGYCSTFDAYVGCDDTAQAVAELITRNAWFVNAITGSDTASGMAGAPVQTFAEIVRRYQGRELSPMGGLLLITLETALLPGDCVSGFWRFAPGYTGIVQGVQTVLHAGTFSAVTRSTFEDPTLVNTDGTVTDAALPGANDWAAWIDEQLVVTSGPAAGAFTWILRDNGAKTATIGEWSSAPLASSADGLTFPPPDLPVAGADYEVRSLPVKVRLGSGFVSYAGCEALIHPDYAGYPTGGLTLRNVEVEDAPGTFTETFGSLNETSHVGYSGCRFNVFLGAEQSHNLDFGSCLFLNGRVAEGDARIFETFPTVHPRAGADFPGGFQFQPACNWYADGCPRFDGERTGYCDLNLQGTLALSGACSFRDAYHCFTCVEASTWGLAQFSTFFGYFGGPPLWGAPNNGVGFLTFSTIAMAHFVVAPDTIKLPTLEFGTGPGGYTIQMQAGPELPFFGAAQQLEKAHSFDRATASYTPQLDTVWASLEVGIPAGFQVDNYVEGDTETHVALMIKPQVGSFFRWQAEIFTPPP